MSWKKTLRPNRNPSLSRFLSRNPSPSLSRSRWRSQNQSLSLSRFLNLNLPLNWLEDRKLVSDEVEQVSAATISGLTAALAASARVGDGNKTLEQLVKELLRPILKDWLDTNLPGMVERIVREEVERIADRAKK